MVYTEVYWSGKGDLSNIYFLKDNFFEYKELEHQQRINELWNEHIKTYSHDYDGKLVILDSFELEEELNGSKKLFIFHVSWIHYSTLVGLTKLTIPIKNYGVLGSQIAIFDPTEQYILVGKRKVNQMYAPGILTLPGGMFEIDDLKPGKNPFLRELHEEVRISINKPILIALLAEHTKRSSIFLIKATLSQPFNSDQVFDDLDNEFEENKLFWLKIEELKKFDPSNLMEGLTYLQLNL